MKPDACTCLLLYSCDFCSFFSALLWQKVKEKCENAVIKGKVSASIIKLSGATQSPAVLSSKRVLTGKRMKKVFWHHSGPKKPAGSFHHGTNVPFSSHLEYFQPRQIKLFQVH